jgi:hypothetical protein
MNCMSIADRITALAAGELPDDQRLACESHIAACEDCADALQGALAMQALRQLDAFEAPAGLFDRIMDDVMDPVPERSHSRGFWTGTAFGGVIAASLLAIVMMLGVLVRPVDVEPQVAQFYVSNDEPRLMHIAIESEHQLAGAQISILLSGDVRIDGAGDRRELSWTDDLEAGVNKLSLPLLASGTGGGQMVVRLSHPDSEQMFVIDLKLDG